MCCTKFKKIKRMPFFKYSNIPQVRLEVMLLTLIKKHVKLVQFQYWLVNSSKVFFNFFKITIFVVHTTSVEIKNNERPLVKVQKKQFKVIFNPAFDQKGTNPTAELN